MSNSDDDFKDFSDEDLGDDFGEFGEHAEIEQDTADSGELQAPELESRAERQVDFGSQVLTTESARSIFKQLDTAAPPEPLNFDYSLTRRQYLQTLGKPLNLDEIGLSKLPPLQVNISHADAPKRTHVPVDSAAINPDVQVDAIHAEIDSIDSDTLNLLSLSALSKMRDSLRSHQDSVNAQLTYNLQQLDALRNDNLTYNELISDLIRETNNKLTKGNSMRSKIQPKSINLMERTGSAGLWGANSLPSTPPERVRSPGESLSGNRVNW
ncbi:hypothetical protein E3P99_02913 [Wallemia hederae]|uniref:Uncharacterized protein n=1 Tax=Wallemia hederae TaxID=1540922 RepID=A0A4T0FI97_9BASI|nr:hypothetical protein E3P99_02913 [Wallemia hederae]